jgi:hypothetical protein
MMAPANKTRAAVILLLSLIPATAESAVRIPRILIVGDSWAASITAEHVDPTPAPDVFDDVLAAEGLGEFETRGLRTAWGGRKASDWAKPEHVRIIHEELEAFPTISHVHLIIGGNDFLSAVLAQGRALESEPARRRLWRRIIRDIETIVKACHEVREGITVVIAGYDYLDYHAAETFWDFDFHGIETATLNQWLEELGDAKRAYAGATPGCVYLGHWGILQREFGGVGETGPAHGMPAAISPDGIHPNPDAHAVLLRNAIEAVYRPAFTQGEASP